MKTHLNLQDLAAELERRAGAKEDYIIDTKGSEMTEALNLRFADKEFALNDTAHGQVGAALEIPAKYYERMRHDAPALLSRNVNHWLGKEPKQRMVRTLDGVGRAFLSNAYQRVENEEIAGVALPVLLDASQDVKIESCALTESRMYIKAVFPKIQGEVRPGDVVQYGLSISNSEVGMGSVKIEPLIFRLVCSNGMIIINDASLNARHIGRRAGISEGVYEMLSDEARRADDSAILLKVRDIVRASFDEVRFERHLSLMRGAAGDRMGGHPEEVVKTLAKRKNLTEFEGGSVLRHLIDGGDLSRWGLLNAVTRTAQDVESYDRATELEAMGGEILEMPRGSWKTLAEAA